MLQKNIIHVINSNCFRYCVLIKWFIVEFKKKTLHFILLKKLDFIRNVPLENKKLATVMNFRTRHVLLSYQFHRIYLQIVQSYMFCGSVICDLQFSVFNLCLQSRKNQFVLQLDILCQFYFRCHVSSILLVLCVPCRNHYKLLSV